MPNKGLTFPAEVLTIDECTSLINTFSKAPTAVRNKSLISVYLYAQLRCNEALDLRPCDVSQSPPALTVLSGKGGKRRVAGIPACVIENEIAAWNAIRPESPYLFCTLKGDRLDESYVRKMLKRKAKQAGITRRVHVHGLRHTGAFQLANNGADVRVISHQLGHSSIAVTDRYIQHLGSGALVEAISQIDW